MLTYYDLGDSPPEGWWKNFNWKKYSWSIADHKPKLLAQVPQWWKYFNWEVASGYLVRHASYLLKQAPPVVGVFQLGTTRMGFN